MLGPTRLTGVQRYTVPNDFITKNWLGLSWSDWLGLDASPKAFRETITPAPGLYRVRVKGTDTLAAHLASRVMRCLAFLHCQRQTEDLLAAIATTRQGISGPVGCPLRGLWRGLYGV